MNERAPPDDLSRESLLAEIADEFLQQIDRGQRPDVSKYAERHPQIADVLRQILPALELMRASPPASEPGGKSPDRPERAGQIGDFRILREIGRGGMGIVYEAEQVSLGRRVALKVLPFAALIDEKQLQRFQNEARAAASLKHSNIVQVYSVGCERAVHFYAMEYVEGQTLAQLIAEKRHKAGDEPALEPVDGQPTQSTNDVRAGPLQRESGDGELAVPHSADQRALEVSKALPPERQAQPAAQADLRGECRTLPDEQDRDLSAGATSQAARAETSGWKSRRDTEFFRQAARWGIQAAEALEYAHQMGVVHRDIKPSNLLIDGQNRLTVTDFGLAQTQAGMQLTMTGDVVGTLRYMSPEQAQGNRRVLDHRTDIYSLGATLYELLTLRPPFESQDRHRLLHEVLEGSVKPLRRIAPAVPRDLETVVLKAMATEPEARYTTAQELADDLGRFLDQRPVRVRRPSLLDHAASWSRRHRSIVRAAIVCLLLIAAILALSTAFVLRAYRGQNDQRLSAEASADRATRNFEEARQAVRQMLTRVADEQVGAIPEMKEVRRRLLDDAVAFYTQLLLLNAEDAAVYADRAEVYMLLARYAEARADFTHAVQLAPDTAAYRFQLGVFLGSCPDVAYRDLARALVHTKRAVELEPRNAAYRGELVVAYIRLRATAEARAAVQSLVAITPPTAQGFAGLARVCLVANDPQAALAWAEKAVALEPAAEWAQFPLAEALASLGERQRALDAVNRLFEQSSALAKSEMPAEWAQLLAKLGDDKRALTLISQAIEGNRRPNDPKTFYLYDTRADIYYRLGKRAEALADLNKSLEMGPFRSYAYKRRGRIYFDLGNYDQALRDVAKAVELKPDDISNLYWIPLAEVAACPDENFRRGILALADKSVAMNSASAGACTVRGDVYQALGQLDEEIARLTRLTNQSPGATEYKSRLAEFRAYQVRLYGDQAQVEKAIGQYTEAIRTKPGAVEPHLQRALAYASKNELDRAFDDLRQALRLDNKSCPSWLCWAASWLPTMIRGTTRVPGIMFVSDMPWVRSSCQLDGNQIDARRDNCVWGPPVTLFPVAGGLACQKGCWAQPFDDRPAEIVVDLQGRNFATFRSSVGSTPQGSVQFRVLADGKLLHETPVLRSGVVEAISVDVRGAKELVLSANCGGDGPGYDAVNWGFARLVEAGADDALEEPPVELRSVAEANAALFLAEVHRRLDQADLARRWYQKAAAWVEENPAQVKSLKRFCEEVRRQLEGGGH